MWMQHELVAQRCYQRFGVISVLDISSTKMTDHGHDRDNEFQEHHRDKVKVCVHAEFLFLLCSPYSILLPSLAPQTPFLLSVLVLVFVRILLCSESNLIHALLKRRDCHATNDIANS
ncbi:hypothetical protein F4604DRAFT_1031456 [Suillus subluteus]|nr:hypothetical protein F4604DRAFT_1031456 [Suillus subluteus]